MIMEDYCTSPSHFRSSTWSANAVPVTPPSEIIQLQPGKKTPEAAATIRDLIDEPIFWRGYTSDEEVASPLVDDNRSFDSGSFCYESEDIVSVHNAPSPQQSTRSLDKGKQQVTRAHAVQFLSAGKAKVVSMPTPCTVRTASSSPTRPPMSKTNRMNVQGRAINFSRTITPKISSEIEPSSRDLQTDEGSLYPQKVVRRKPNVPALQAVSRSQSPSHVGSAFITPRSARRAGFVEPDESLVASALSEAAWFSQPNTPEKERPTSQSKKTIIRSLDSDPEPYPAQEASPVPDSPPFSLPQNRGGNYVLQSSSSMRRPALFSTGSMTQDMYTFPESPSLSCPRLLRKLSTTFSFKTFTRPSRQDSFSSNESEKLQPVQETTSKSAHVISYVHTPTRTSSKPLPKMVPRAANERAPPIVIPPCPDDYNDADLPARWPQTKDTVPKHDQGANAASSDDMAIEADVKAPKAHQRKKSHSTSSGSGSS